jgi:hypothetical protein
VSHFNKMLIASTLFLLACPLGTEKTIWAEKGSTISHLSFGLGHVANKPDTIGVAVLSVTRCESSMKDEVWHLDAIGKDVQTSRILYGQAPEGFKEKAPARPLTIGCYAVTIGEGGNEFDVKTDGSIMPREY